MNPGGRNIQTGPEVVYDEFPSVSPQSARHITKIAWGSAVHERALRAKREQEPDFIQGSHYFGSDFLYNVMRIRESPVAEIDPDFKQWALEDIHDEFESAKDELLLWFNDPDPEDKQIHFVAARLLEEARETGLQTEEDDLIKGAKKLVESLTDEDLERLLEYHVNRELERQGEFEAIVASMIRDFIDRTKEAVAAGRLPIDFDIERLKGRLFSLKISGIDPFSVYSTGAYDPETHSLKLIRVQSLSELLSIPISEGDEEAVSLEHVLYHEGFHADAGKLVIYSDEEQDIAITRSGLNYRTFEADIYPPHEVKIGISRFEWLDEAITETLAMKVRGTENPGGRVEECKLYDLLKTRGKQEIPEELFIDAYLENYDPTQPPGQRDPAWKKLRRAINEAYDPAFIVELDKMVVAYKPFPVARYDLTEAGKFLSGLPSGEYGRDGYTLEDFRKLKALQLGISTSTSTWAQIADAEKRLVKNS
jgi:hypothetical protein